MTNRITALIVHLLLACLLGLNSCQLSEDTAQRDVAGADTTASPSSSAARQYAPEGGEWLELLKYPADRDPSWLTSAYPQEIADQHAADELAAMGFDFGGKHFTEQAIAGNTAAVRLFLKAGIDVNTRSLGGTTALAGAAANGRTDVVRLLLEHGADVTLRETGSQLTALLYAVRGGATDIVKLLLEHGASANDCDVRLDSALIMAVMEQHEEIVRLLLERGAAADAPSMRNTTPLTYAAGYPSLEIVKMLVEAGANVNATDSSGSTPLLLAAKFGTTDNFEFLVEHGGSLDAESFTGLNLLHAAAESGVVEIAQQLVARGMNINQPDRRTGRTPLLIALENRRLEMAEWLLANGADPRPRCIFGYSALDLARRLFADCDARTAEERREFGFPELADAEELLQLAEQAAADRGSQSGMSITEIDGGREASADAKSKPKQISASLPEPSLDEKTLAAIERIPAQQIDKLSESEARKLLDEHEIDFTADVFVETCIFGWRRLFEIFLAAGIDPNIKREPDGGNAITAACLLGDPEMVAILIDKGADLDSTFNENQAPCMHFAALSQENQVVTLLLRHGQDIDARDLGGRTALMKAAELGYLEVAALLINNGADANAADNNGLTALHWALRSGQVETLKLLVERGADIEIADSYGITPAFAAALFGRKDVYLFLREHGARIDQVLDDGTTIIHAAVAGGQRAIVEDVLAAGYEINTRHPERGDTPIYGALDRLDADIDFIRFLLDSGAEVNTFDKVVGYSPLMVAAINSNADIFKLLIEYGADYTAASDKGVTVLHVATMNDSPEMVAKLLELGVDVFAKDGEGKTAFDRAMEFNCNRVEPILREAMGLPAQEPAGTPDK